MRQKITLKHIARELDISISTVSKALKGNKEISEDTRQKVKAFAKLYNYKPNNIALSLKNRKTKTIAVIIPEILHHFFAKVIRGIERVANKSGYQVLICSSNNSFDKEVIHLEMLASGSADGFILSIAKETLQNQDYHHIAETISQGMPVVLFDRVVDSIFCDKIIVDDTRGAQDAVMHLLAQGSRRIVLLTTVDYISVGLLRTQGYLRAIKAYDLEIDETLILKIEDMENCEQQILSFLKDKEFDGIFAVNELFAIIASKAVRLQNKVIPDDVAIIGFSDGLLSKHASPTLTTVSQHGEQMGEKAAELLIHKLENQQEGIEEYRTIVIDTELIQRESTR